MGSIGGLQGCGGSWFGFARLQPLRTQLSLLRWGLCWQGGSWGVGDVGRDRFPPCPNQHKCLFIVCALPYTSQIPQCSHGHTPVPGSPTTLNNSPPRAVTALLCGSSGRAVGRGQTASGARVRLGAGQSGGGAKGGGWRRIRSAGRAGCAWPKRSVQSGSEGRRAPQGRDARYRDAPHPQLWEAAPGTHRARLSGMRVAGRSAPAVRDARCRDARRPTARDALQRGTAAPGRSPPPGPRAPRPTRGQQGPRSSVTPRGSPSPPPRSEPRPPRAPIAAVPGAGARCCGAGRGERRGRARRGG